MKEMNESELRMVEGGSEIGYWIGFYARKFWDALSELNSNDLQELQKTNPVSVWN